ncbi:hypothetical protein OSTOST_04103 [Ostertagia ostertagi]
MVDHATGNASVMERYFPLQHLRPVSSWGMNSTSGEPSTSWSIEGIEIKWLADLLIHDRLSNKSLPYVPILGLNTCTYANIGLLALYCIAIPLNVFFIATILPELTRRCVMKREDEKICRGDELNRLDWRMMKFETYTTTIESLVAKIVLIVMPFALAVTVFDHRVLAMVLPMESAMFCSIILYYICSTTIHRVESSPGTIITHTMSNLSSGSSVVYHTTTQRSNLCRPVSPHNHMLRVSRSSVIRIQPVPAQCIRDIFTALLITRTRIPGKVIAAHALAKLKHLTKQNMICSAERLCLLVCPSLLSATLLMITLFPTDRKDTFEPRFPMSLSTLCLLVCPSLLSATLLMITLFPTDRKDTFEPRFPMSLSTSLPRVMLLTALLDSFWRVAFFFQLLEIDFGFRIVTGSELGDEILQRLLETLFEASSRLSRLSAVICCNSDAVVDYHCETMRSILADQKKRRTMMISVH